MTGDAAWAEVAATEFKVSGRSEIDHQRKGQDPAEEDREREVEELAPVHYEPALMMMNAAQAMMSIAPMIRPAVARPSPV